MNKEKKLDQYINTLNKERMPKEHRRPTEDQEFEELLETVRRVKSLKEPVLPKEDYPVGLAAALKEGTRHDTGGKRFTLHRYVRRSLVAVAAAAAMAVLYLAVPERVAPWKEVSIVQAMEQAYEELKAYHGVMEVVETNALGETMIQSKREVWVDQDGKYRVVELEGYYKGMVTANNGDTRWQLRPEEKTAYLYPTFPDPYRFTFELGSEIEHVKRALTVKEVGEEIIAGRDTVILEVTPEGGDSYRLWVDKETDLPLQKETAMQNALQLKVAYTNIEFLEAIPKEELTYQLPKDYEVVEIAPEQLVGSVEEAGRLAGFTPVLPEKLPEGYQLEQLAVRYTTDSVKEEGDSDIDELDSVKGELDSVKGEGDSIKGEGDSVKGEIDSVKGEGDSDKAEANSVKDKVGSVKDEANSMKGGVGSVRLSYQSSDGRYRIDILQTQADKDRKPNSNAILGTINGTIAELQSNYEGQTDINSVRWQEAGLEYIIYGNVDWRALGKFAESLTGGTLLVPEGKVSRMPKVEVPIDMSVEENEQKSVDAGHSPWKLDPTFVAQVFASLLISPEGIVGEYPIPYESIEIIENTGTEAIAKINHKDTQADYIYMKRLVRQDATGIWTVVGYDPVE